VQYSAYRARARMGAGAGGLPSSFFALCLLVVSVMMLIRFDAEQRVPYFTAVINPTAMVANAVRSRHLVVVYKPREVAVDIGLHCVFCALLRANLRVVGKFARVAAKAHIVVMRQVHSPVRPVFALYTAMQFS
jgi:hypothetical protein